MTTHATTPADYPPVDPEAESRLKAMGLNANGALSATLPLAAARIEGERVIGHTKPARKIRSDAGRPKPKKVGPVPGSLTRAQIARLRELMEEREQALQANTDAESAMLKACQQFEDYLESLTKEPL